MESGQSVPVTVIKIGKGKSKLIKIKTKRGYSAIKVGFLSLKLKINKTNEGLFCKKKYEPKKILRI